MKIPRSVRVERPVFASPPQKLRGGRWRGIIAALVMALFAAVGSVAIAPTAQASSHYCGSSEYVDHIDVTHYPDPNDFTINVYPTSAARHDPQPRTVTNSMWHAVQACVSGLYDGLADKMYDQLECHQFLASAPGVRSEQKYETGDSYGLDSWSSTFASTYNSWIITQCGNTLGEDPTDSPTGTSRPDLGEGDIWGDTA